MTKYFIFDFVILMIGMVGCGGAAQGNSVMNPVCLRAIERLQSLIPPSSEYSNLELEIYEILEPVNSTADGSQIVPHLFLFMERMADYPKADLGTRGPQIHFIEKQKGYEEHLVSSLMRRPTMGTVLMVNAILNTDLSKSKREYWLGLLHEVSKRASTEKCVRDFAIRFINYQMGFEENPPVTDQDDDRQ
jgi:hypothetical protein